VIFKRNGPMAGWLTISTTSSEILVRNAFAIIQQLDTMGQQQA